MTNHQLTTLFLALALALALISLLAFGAGALARRLRQPPVVGEVLLGVLSGPTLLGDGAGGDGTGHGPEPAQAASSSGRSARPAPPDCRAVRRRRSPSSSTPVV
ncbi:hypothetical protein ACFZC6_18290 [Streptomyces ossamyceticus]|uniref:hypothetical protein n=1 Tax=Streptomyces ossamyceticus TaxID=249581 RepID=UPI0036F14A23